MSNTFNISRFCKYFGFDLKSRWKDQGLFRLVLRSPDQQASYRSKGRSFRARHWYIPYGFPITDIWFPDRQGPRIRVD